ncbi:hypothetical protein DCAR_0314336 [Daucus carota subsp. sativus]|uniref:F-box associated beta-propeller type 3 domain-containing protein n=1 Tax=Daucus carota subsp. sativus TaxID=79200 RepID=A0A169WHU8_DAUCS|nr:hypothetical protein DCAR_0314336 [Daucus carota subsp. sativus]
MHENVHAVINGGLIISQPKKLCLADYESLHDDVTNPIEIVDPVIKSLLSDAKLVGSVNGLVCFCLRNYDVILMNPSTRKWITLPVEPHELRRKFFNHDFGVLKGGFGYDPVSDDYKFVKLRMSDNPFGKIIVTVYSARTNSWKHIRNARLSRNVYLKDEWGMFAGGALYWKARDFGKKSERGKGSEIIVGFDLGLGQFRAVASDSNCWSLRDFGGYLYTLDNSKSRVDVFQRNYHSAENPWSTAFSIMGRNVFGVNGVRPLMYSESLGEVLILVDCKRPVWYHLESERVKKVRLNRIRRLITSDAEFYTESLFQFPKDREPQNLLHEIRRASSVVIFVESGQPPEPIGISGAVETGYKLQKAIT